MDIEWKRLREVLEHFGEYFVNKAGEILRSEGHIASGELLNSIKVNPPVIDDEHYEVTVQLADYWKYLNDGTGPGHEPDKREQYWLPIDVIKKWIQVKRIVPQVRPVQRNGKFVEYCPTVKQLPYAIQAGIHKNGTKATHFFDMAKEDAINYFKESIYLAIKEDIEEYITSVVSSFRI